MPKDQRFFLQWNSNTNDKKVYQNLNCTKTQFDQNVGISITLKQLF